MAVRERRRLGVPQAKLMKSLEKSPQQRHNCVQSWEALAENFANGLLINQGDTDGSPTGPVQDERQGSGYG